jgi:hypothetical protein
MLLIMSAVRGSSQLIARSGLSHAFGNMKTGQPVNWGHLRLIFPAYSVSIYTGRIYGLTSLMLGPTSCEYLSPHAVCEYRVYAMVGFQSSAIRHQEVKKKQWNEAYCEC